MEKRKKEQSCNPTAEEKRDLQMISLAYFDLFSKFKPRPSKTQMIYWVRKFRNDEIK